ncbi:hypothetical protein HZS38_09675 [Xenorhabdus nematophila]|uniref:hypothetical protein n=1 Tax=Xenorhabdus nematophila TaxID=628 RepID=UPI000542FE06|nr:hypothetical protein [Xenorhabdus nematophila]CEF32691.1 conserved hypothetical protein [Xenorhabdus nematophila str. Websteri]AYA40653.1 hypothetical protein D3790_09595 [Xenorhabdus nematophila]KHD29295.1 hypothetical protein LH67_04410 [Xenorhabdus nematophila]MBA0019393.1 hypothetical protein [Xenorhabdus nematophila]MCB4424228.1 hypothetical protein [Xenorhabdus nematophila]
MAQLTLLERKRKALIYAKLDTLKKKYGSYSEFIEVNDFNYRLDLDEEILTLALINLFEKDAVTAGGEKLLIESYSNFYTQHGNLTIEGNEFINEILKLVAKKTEPIR